MAGKGSLREGDRGSGRGAESGWGKEETVGRRGKEGKGLWKGRERGKGGTETGHQQKEKEGEETDGREGRGRMAEGKRGRKGGEGAEEKSRKGQRKGGKDRVFRL